MIAIGNRIDIGRSGGGIPIQPEYLTVKAAMTTPPSDADEVIQNRWVYDLKPIWNKAILLDNFACPTLQASLLNWKNPLAFNPTTNGVHTAYKGLYCAGWNKGTNLHFIPSSDGAGFLGQNDITVILGINEDYAGTPSDFGGAMGTNKQLSFNSRNSSLGIEGSVNGTIIATGMLVRSSKSYFGISRDNATQEEITINYISQRKNHNSVGLCDGNLTGCGGKAGEWGNSRMTSFILIFKYLNDSEKAIVIDACDRYLKNYTYNIRTYQTAIKFNLVIEGHSFTEPWTSFPVGLFQRTNVSRLNNFGTGGATVSTLVARQATTDAALIIETSSYKNIMTLWIGVNEVINTAGQGTTAYNAMKSYIQSRVAAGWKVFVFTMTPTTYSGRGATYESERGIFNGLMRSDLALLNNVYVMDTDTKAELSDCTNTTYFNADTLHLTATGLLLATTLFETKMIELYG